MKILIVDDEPSILEVLKAFLEAGDAHQAVTATSGAAALAQIDATSADFDCFLLDIQMPTMNGLVLCEKLRAIPRYARSPIIMLTAMSQKPYIDKAFAVGATDYVTKPFDFLELRGRLTAAGKMVEESQRLLESAEKTKRQMLEAEEEIKPHPDEPVSIDGVERVVGYTALENYLFTLSRTKLMFASTFALAINEFRALHSATSAREMRAILKLIARAAIDDTPNSGNLVSYRGNGVFLCVNQKKSAISISQRIAQVNAALSEYAAVTPAKGEVRVSVGQEISLLSFSRAGALVALRRAIDTIEVEPVSEKDLITISKRALRNNVQTLEQANLERRAYQIALEEIIREENNRAG